MTVGFVLLWKIGKLTEYLGMEDTGEKCFPKHLEKLWQLFLCISSQGKLGKSVLFLELTVKVSCEISFCEPKVVDIRTFYTLKTVDTSRKFVFKDWIENDSEES